MTLRIRTALLGLILIAASTSGQTDKVSYVVSYLGIPLVDMVQTLEYQDSLVTMTYDNQLRPYLQPFKEIHNIYRVTYVAASFNPLRWSKDIQEGELEFSLKARRNLKNGRVRYSDGSTREFAPGTFTVFSATHYLESIAQQPEKFPVRLKIFIDGELWEAMVNRYADDSESMLDDHPAGTVLLRARLKYLSGRSMVSQNDILTSRIASQGSQFLLWVNEDGLIVRARFGTFPQAVELDLID